MIRTLSATIVAFLPTVAIGGSIAPSDIAMSDGLVTWLRAQSTMEAAQWVVLDEMHLVDQLDGLRAERLQSDMDHMLMDRVSEVIERAMRSDIDDDAEISLPEFVAMNPAENPDTLRNTFLTYDPDGNGLTDRRVVASVERQVTQQSNATSPLHEMATWELDGDRLVTRVEIQLVLAAQSKTIWPSQ